MNDPITFFPKSWSVEERWEWISTHMSGAWIVPDKDFNLVNTMLIKVGGDSWKKESKIFLHELNASKVCDI